MTTRSQPVERAIETLLFAPIGLGAKLVDDGPDIAKRVSQELSNARFIGRLTVGQGLSAIRSKLEEPAATVSEAPAPGTTSAASVPESASPAADVVDVDLLADDLALPDYDDLPAIDIVAKLESLTADERQLIGAYETANRARRTVLGKLAQLAS